MQARLKFGHGRRQDEDRNDVRLHLVLKLLGALPVDIEQHVAAGSHRIFHRPTRGAVKIAVNLCPFQQRIAIPQALEFTRGNEMVVNAVNLALAARARRDADGQADILVLVEQVARNRRFARARWRRNHQHQPSAGNRDGRIIHRDHGVYSRFWTCSRNWSITTFSSMPAAVTALAFDLEQIVFDSRLNSCARKSSLRPTGPPLAKSSRDA